MLETPFDSVYGGRFRMVIYRNMIDQTEHVVLVKGKVDAEKPTLVRMHRVDMAADMLGHVGDPPGTCAQGAGAPSPSYDGARRGGLHPRAPTRRRLSERYGQPARADRGRATSCATTASARRSCSTSACATWCCSAPPRPSSPARARAATASGSSDARSCRTGRAAATPAGAISAAHRAGDSDRHSDAELARWAAAPTCCRAVRLPRHKMRGLARGGRAQAFVPSSAATNAAAASSQCVKQARVQRWIGGVGATRARPPLATDAIAFCA